MLLKHQDYDYCFLGCDTLQLVNMYRRWRGTRSLLRRRRSCSVDTGGVFAWDVNLTVTPVYCLGQCFSTFVRPRPGKFFLTCICLSRRLFRVTLEISRAECNIDVTPGTLTATDTCIGYHVTRFEASRYVSTCVGAGGGRGRGTKIKTKANRCGACLNV
jgi:hypothetical protein